MDAAAATEAMEAPTLVAIALDGSSPAAEHAVTSVGSVVGVDTKDRHDNVGGAIDGPLTCPPAAVGAVERALAAQRGVEVVTRVRVRHADGVMRINDYVALSTLGQGSYGEVILARDERLAAPAAAAGAAAGETEALMGGNATGGTSTGQRGSGSIKEQAPLVALKCFSKARLMKKRDIRRSGRRTLVVTALDKVQREIQLMRAMAARGGHPNVIALSAVLSDPGSDDLYFGAFANASATRLRLRRQSPALPFQRHT
jgi:hypothetical protein